MNAEAELLRAYREWHRLVRTERKAIQTRNWSLLSDCHLAIKDYQSRVKQLTQEARAEWQRAGCDQAEKERDIHALISGLIDITRDNNSRLRSALAAARQQLSGLQTAGVNLKRIQRSYGVMATAPRFSW